MNKLGALLAVVAALVAALIFFGAIQFHTFELFGHKGRALFDLWSLQHLVGGAVVGWILLRLENKGTAQTGTFVIMALLVAYTWEFIELFAEEGVYGSMVASWFQLEFWVSRLLVDPALVVVGAIMYRQYFFP